MDIKLKNSDGEDLYPVGCAMTTTTWEKVKALRDGGTLIRGMLYRITDYVTTTTQADTQSAGHQFDIIVKALSAGTLSEEARAIRHDGDSELSDATSGTAYFANSKLQAWQVWYCLDNDTARFAWADTTNGKGVIYRLIDEFRNDLPYDFKNIQFKRYKVTATTGKSEALVNTYQGMRAVDSASMYPQKCTISTTDTAFRFTFDYGGGKDYSLNTYANADSGEYAKHCYGNALAPVWLNSKFNGTSGSTNIYYRQQLLNNIVFLNTSTTAECHGNKLDGSQTHTCTFGSGCYGNKAGVLFRYNSYGNNCYSNSYGNSCGYNSYGSNCNYNSYGSDCWYNSYGNSCGSNSYGNSCSYNSYGNSCSYNSYGNSCGYNSYGNSCSYNSYGSNCNYNSYGNSCSYNSYGNDCWYNSYGNNCYSNSYGNDCYNNSYGNNCTSNTCGNDCYYYTFTPSDNVIQHKGLACSIVEDSSEDDDGNITLNSRIYTLSNGGPARTVTAKIVESDGDTQTTIFEDTVSLAANETKTVATSADADSMPDSDNSSFTYTENGISAKCGLSF